jgi:hypothetical protein
MVIQIKFDHWTTSKSESDFESNLLLYIVNYVIAIVGLAFCFDIESLLNYVVVEYFLFFNHRQKNVFSLIVDSEKFPIIQNFVVDVWMSKITNLIFSILMPNCTHG